MRLVGRNTAAGTETATVDPSTAVLTATAIAIVRAAVAAERSAL